MDLATELADINRRLTSHRQADRQLTYLRRHIWRKLVDNGIGYRGIRDIHQTSTGENISDSRIQQEVARARKELKT